MYTRYIMCVQVLVCVYMLNNVSIGHRMCVQVIKCVYRS